MNTSISAQFLSVWHEGSDQCRTYDLYSNAVLDNYVSAMLLLNFPQSRFHWENKIFPLGHFLKLMSNFPKFAFGILFFKSIKIFSKEFKFLHENN